MPIPIVGTKHNPRIGGPPGNILLSILPHGAQVHLIPEPDNPVDPRAIAVRLHRDALKRCNASAVAFVLSPLGYTPQQILDREWWHLGYIPARWYPRPEGEVEGRLSFSPRGQPQVEGV